MRSLVIRVNIAVVYIQAYSGGNRILDWGRRIDGKRWLLRAKNLGRRGKASAKRDLG